MVYIFDTKTSQFDVYLGWLVAHAGRLAPRQVDGTLRARRVNAVSVKGIGTRHALGRLILAF